VAVSLGDADCDDELDKDAVDVLVGVMVLDDDFVAVGGRDVVRVSVGVTVPDDVTVGEGVVVGVRDAALSVADSVGVGGGVIVADSVREADLVPLIVCVGVVVKVRDAVCVGGGEIVPERETVPEGEVVSVPDFVCVKEIFFDAVCVRVCVPDSDSVCRVIVSVGDRVCVLVFALPSAAPADSSKTSEIDRRAARVNIYVFVFRLIFEERRMIGRYTRRRRSTQVALESVWLRGLSVADGVTQ
jgi:hypothetical protein